MNSTELKEIFKEALSQSIASYSERNRIAIYELLLHICGELRPYMVVTPAGAEAISDRIFSNDIHRDFIFTLLFNFTPRLSIDRIEENFAYVVRSLAFGLSNINKINIPGYATANEDHIKLPEEVVDRLPTESSIIQLLKSNKWLVMILLINLYMSVADFEVSAESGKSV